MTKEKTGDSMQVGLNIKIKRIGRGYTQEEIADAIGVARSTIHKIRVRQETAGHIQIMCTGRLF